MKMLDIEPVTRTLQWSSAEVEAFEPAAAGDHEDDEEDDEADADDADEPLARFDASSDAAPVLACNTHGQLGKQQTRTSPDSLRF